jgi:hypothetical protein
MSYQFARINLAKTSYRESVQWTYLDKTDEQIDRCLEIYRTYCIYKHFGSVMPLFVSRFQDPMADVIGYYNGGIMVAFSLIRRYDDKNAMCDQFAWTYHDPKLRLGIETMKTECAIYLARGFDYLYLEQAHLYKQEIEGFEILGPMT